MGFLQVLRPEDRTALTNAGRPRSYRRGATIIMQELASVIAASRESVVRALATLRSAGFIATRKRRITVRDPEGLRRYAG